MKAGLAVKRWCLASVLLLISTLLLCGDRAWAQVSTLAGSGIAGFADGPGTTARFNAPESAARDAFGNIYVADTGNHRIRKVTLDGMVSTLAGTGVPGFADGQGASAQFRDPVGLAIDAAGNLYVGDIGNQRIRKITPDGTVSTLAGSGIAGYADGPGADARFNGPAGLAVDAAGNVYVADVDNRRVRKITPDGMVSTLAGTGVQGFADGDALVVAKFFLPLDVAVDAAGNVYVADAENLFPEDPLADRIRKISGGVVSTLAGSGIDAYLDGPAATARFRFPRSVAVDAAGNVYVGELFNGGIRKITPAGNVSTLAGDVFSGFADGSATEALLSDAEAGQSLAGSARFAIPQIAEFNNVPGGEQCLIISDRNNHRIRKIKLTDTTPPVIALNGPSTMTVQCPGPYNELGATVGDNCDLPSLVISGSVNAAVVGMYTRTYTATDASGNMAVATRTVNVVDTTTPVANAGGPYSVDEGSAVGVTATGSDPDGEPLTFAWDLNNDGIFETPGQSVTFSASGLDGPSSRPIAVRVTNNCGLSATAQTTVTVQNVAPTVGVITAPVDPVPVNTTITASAPFTDPGVPDTHTATWAWGDGTTSPGTVNAGSVSGSHPYTTAGVYEVTLTVTDDDGGAGQAVFHFVVVFDPSAGFVTGGGWINSSPGAYTPDPTLTGKATFGFVSKYLKGANTPSGQTQFTFKVANLNFHSSSYEWLVVAGAQAKFKGTGTINGSGDYSFLLTATDGQVNGGGGVDKFRIKIQGPGGVIYDNQPGATDNADPNTALGGGSIVIHSGGAAKPTVASVVPTRYALIQNTPNPFNPTTQIAYEVPQSAHVTLVVYNLLGQEVVRLVDAQQTPGQYVVRWDGRNGQGLSVASGVYLYRLTTSTGFTQTRRMTLLK